MNVEISYDYREADMVVLPVAELAQWVLQAEECPENSEVSIAFVSDEDMARMNEEYRGKTGATDVLSFECDDWDDYDPDMPFALGDVIVAVDVAHRQTAEFGTTMEGEITQLLMHGLLHLCGYDHIDDAEAEEMEAREAELLGVWAARRDLDPAIFGQVNEGFARIRGEH